MLSVIHLTSRAYKCPVCEEVATLKWYLDENIIPLTYSCNNPDCWPRMGRLGEEK